MNDKMLIYGLLAMAFAATALLSIGSANRDRELADLKARVAKAEIWYSITWGEDYRVAHMSSAPEIKTYRFVFLHGAEGAPGYEFGLRADGVVVWREVGPSVAIGGGNRPAQPAGKP